MNQQSCTQTGEFRDGWAPPGLQPSRWPGNEATQKLTVWWWMLPFQSGTERGAQGAATLAGGKQGEGPGRASERKFTGERGGFTQRKPLSRVGAGGGGNGVGSEQVHPHSGSGALGSFRPPSQRPPSPFPTLGSGAWQTGLTLPAFPLCVLET